MEHIDINEIIRMIYIIYEQRLENYYYSSSR